MKTSKSIQILYHLGLEQLSKADARDLVGLTIQSIIVKLDDEERFTPENFEEEFVSVVKSMVKAKAKKAA